MTRRRRDPTHHNITTALTAVRDLLGRHQQRDPSDPRTPIRIAHDDTIAPRGLGIDPSKERVTGTSGYTIENEPVRDTHGNPQYDDDGLPIIRRFHVLSRPRPGDERGEADYRFAIDRLVDAVGVLEPTWHPPAKTYEGRYKPHAAEQIARALEAMLQSTPPETLKSKQAGRVADLVETAANTLAYVTGRLPQPVTRWCAVGCGRKAADGRRRCWPCTHAGRHHEPSHSSYSR